MSDTGESGGVVRVLDNGSIILEINPPIIVPCKHCKKDIVRKKIVGELPQNTDITKIKVLIFELKCSACENRTQIFVKTQQLKLISETPSTQN
ncbi:hypothetical protein ACFL29_01335 [Patescibacteria group bacterium]